MPTHSLDRGRYWYEFGNFESETVQKIDKEKIRGVLQREIEVSELVIKDGKPYESIRRQ